MGWLLTKYILRILERFTFTFCIASAIMYLTRQSDKSRQEPPSLPLQSVIWRGNIYPTEQSDKTRVEPPSPNLSPEFRVGSPGLRWHPCYESWNLKYSVSVPPSWEKPRSIASSPHVVLVTLVSMACCQFATHRVLCVQVSTTPVVCHPQWLFLSVHQSSLQGSNVTPAPHQDPTFGWVSHFLIHSQQEDCVCDIWLSFFFSYSPSVETLLKN